MSMVNPKARLLVTSGFHRANAPVVQENTFSHDCSGRERLYNPPAPYGAILAVKLEARGFCLEVGPGLGTIARAFTEELDTQEIDYHYVMLDLATANFPIIREKVVHRNARTCLVRGDALSLPFCGRAFQTAIANEMIGDLPTLEGLSHGEIERNPSIREMISLFGINIDDAPQSFALNIGAWMLLNELSRVLAPGGRFFVSENATEPEEQYPSPKRLRGHVEYDIHFEQLNAAARAVGFDVEETGDLPTLIFGEDPCSRHPKNLSYSIFRKRQGFDEEWHLRRRALYHGLTEQLPIKELPGMSMQEREEGLMMNM